MNVFIAEDNDDLRLIISKLLEEQGHTVMGASNGKEALNLIKSSNLNYSLLVTDFNMPYMNGDELIKAVKTEKLPVGKIVVISGLPENEENVSALLEIYPEVKFIHKTIDPWKMIDSILNT